MIMKSDADAPAESVLGRPAKLRVEKRIARLQELLDSGAAETALATRHLVSQSTSRSTSRSGSATRILIRSRLLTVTEDHPGRTRIQTVSASKSAALQVLLLALFELQVRPPRFTDSRTRLPIAESVNPLLPAWVEFTALPTTDSTRRRTHARLARANRVRQIKGALDRLAACGRAELQPHGAHGRYEHFRVLNEGAANGPGASITYYARPSPGRGKARRQVVSVPVEFFLNGWVDALSDNEIITYLSLRLMAQAFPDRHAEGGVFLTQADRVATFNLDRGFEAHRMLSRYGLIDTIRDERRNADGTMTDFGETGAGNIHRFKLDDTTLAQPALPRVITSLRRFASGLDSDISILVDAIDPSITDVYKLPP
jgi:hypothetical protein